MTPVDAIKLENAVLAVSCEIQKTTNFSRPTEFIESDLWREAVCCMLSSQVPYPVAQAMTKQFVDRAYIEKFSQRECCSLEEIMNVMTLPIEVEGRMLKYRFPNLGGQRIYSTVERFRNSGLVLGDLVGCEDDPTEIRGRLVGYVCGFGAKQASMFMRNIGVSWDLAIIDRHVLRYMELVGLAEERKTANLYGNLYLDLEMRLKSYGEGWGYAVGCIDWAIWFVMKRVGRARI